MKIADDLLMAMDPVAFAQAAGITPDGWQRDVLRSGAPRTLLNIHRQAGKSLMAAILAVHDAVYMPDRLVLVLSPSLRQSAELCRKVMRVYADAGRPVPAIAQSALQLTLANGSRIVALPGQEGTVRGFSGVTRLIVDEASRVDDALYFSVRPMLAVSNGSLVAMSTPFGARGWWYEAWRSTEPWERHEVQAAMCPRISKTFLAEERRNLGEWFYRQEYECAFLDGQTSMFTRDEIDAAYTEEVDTWAV